MPGKVTGMLEARQSLAVRCADPPQGDVMAWHMALRVQGLGFRHFQAHRHIRPKGGAVDVGSVKGWPVGSRQLAAAKLLLLWHAK